MSPSAGRWLLAALVLGVLPGLGAGSARGGEGDASRDWKLERRSDEPGQRYVLYARPRPGSSFPEYRMEVPVDAPPEDVMAALEHNMLDPDTYPKGMRRELLRREEGLYVSHDYIRVPFISDRDVVVRTETGRDPETGVHRMTWKSTLEEGPPPGDGVVRMPHSEGSWTLHPHGDGATLAVYHSHVELGGSVPAAFALSRMPVEIVQQAVELLRTMRERRVAKR